METFVPLGDNALTNKYREDALAFLVFLIEKLMVELKVEDVPMGKTTVTDKNIIF